MDLTNRVFRKTPIIITPFQDRDKGWRAEIADNWENYKPSKYENINFEDLGFHFHVETYYGQYDPYVFPKKKDAVAAAKNVVKELNGKAKIWHI